MIRLARPSSSASDGGAGSFWGFTRRQVMRVGAAQVRGGTTTRSPWCRLPRMEPPRASTMKLTRNLVSGQRNGQLGTLQLVHTQSVHVPQGLGTHPVCTGLATGLMLSEVSVAGLLGIRESSSNSLEGCVGQKRVHVGTGSYLGVWSLPSPPQSHSPPWTALCHWVHPHHPRHVWALL